MSNLNYLCFVDGLLEYASSDPDSFAHYQLVYAEEHKNDNVQYLTLSDEEYDEMMEWLGPGFDPEYIDIKEINKMLREKDFGCITYD